MDRLTPKNFQETIDLDQYSFVVFGSLDCTPCQMLKQSIDQISPSWPQIHWYDYGARQLGSEEIIKKYRINYMPRSIVFKKGEEVGRIMLYKDSTQLAAKLQELIETGKILTEASDAEEVSLFYTRVQAALGWDFRRDFPYEHWQTKGNELMEKAHSIIEKCASWSLLSPQELVLQL